MGLVLVGFAPTFYLVPDTVATDFPASLVIHGLVLSLWFFWLALQVSLVRIGRTGQHRTMGMVGALIGVATIFAGPLVTIGYVGRLQAKGLSWDSNMSAYPTHGIESMTFDEFARMLVFGNFSAALVFAIFLIAAIYWRSTAVVHKRLMTYASIAIISPALARISRWPYLGGEDGPVIPLLFVSLILSVVIHDKIALGKVPRVTWLCVVVTFGVQVAALLLSSMDIAGEWVHGLA